MANFLDTLAASWGGGYDLDEFARRRAMNDAMMNLGTTLMMAGGSGSWRAAAPMLAQAVPSAMGAFRGTLDEENRRKLVEEENQRRNEEIAWRNAERDRIQAERDEALRQRALLQKVADSEASLMEKQIDADYERALNDPDITDKSKAEQFWNTSRVALENYYLTKQPEMLLPLKKVLGDFQGEIEYTENLNKDAERAAVLAGFGSAEDRREILEEQKRLQRENTQTLIDARRDRETAAQAEANAKSELAGLIAAGQEDQIRVGQGIMVLPSGAVLPATPQVMKNSQDAAMLKGIFTSRVDALKPLWGQSRDPRQVSAFGNLKRSVASDTFDPSKLQENEKSALAQIAMAMGEELPRTAPEVRDLVRRAADITTAQKHIYGDVYGAQATTRGGGGVASFATSPEDAEVQALHPARRAAYDAVRAAGADHATALAQANLVQIKR